MNTEQQLTKDEIVDKVKRLLSLANGTNFEGESDQALRMARKLLAKYNLSMSDVERGSYEKEDPEFVNSYIKLGYWQTAMAKVIAEYCNCFAYHSLLHNEIRFIGMKHELEICIFTFHSVCSQIDKMLRKKRREIRDIREKNGENRQDRTKTSHYTRGYSQGVVFRMKDRLKKLVNEEETGMALVLVKNPKVEQWVKDNIHYARSTRIAKSASEQGRLDGYTDGGKITIHKGINYETQRKITN